MEAAAVTEIERTIMHLRREYGYEAYNVIVNASKRLGRAEDKNKRIKHPEIKRSNIRKNTPACINCLFSKLRLVNKTLKCYNKMSVYHGQEVNMADKCKLYMRRRK